MSAASVETRLAADWGALVESTAAGEARPFAPGALSPAGLSALIAENRARWRAIALALEVGGGAERLVTTAWSARDLLAHLASWAAEFRRELETIVRGEAFDYRIVFRPGVGPTEWNEAALDARRERSLGEVLAEYEAETDRFDDLVLSLPDDAFARPVILPLAVTGDPAAPLTVPLAGLVAARCGHESHHLSQLERLVERSSR